MSSEEASCENTTEESLADKESLKPECGANTETQVLTFLIF
jgi:hypothetical protein